MWFGLRVKYISFYTNKLIKMNFLLHQIILSTTVYIFRDLVKIKHEFALNLSSKRCKRVEMKNKRKATKNHSTESIKHSISLSLSNTKKISLQLTAQQNLTILNHLNKFELNRTL